jgi:DNA end-binding protein Ku
MRAIWNGALTFGLINIPVRIYGAAEERALKFRMLDKKTHSPISYVKVRKTDGKEVPYDNIVKGYEYQKHEFVILNDEDFEKASPKKTSTIEIESFVDEDEVDSILIDKPYYIEPDPKAEKAYGLFREALKKSKRVGIGKIVFKDKEHLVMIKPEKIGHINMLMLVTLRYADEIRPAKELHIPEKIAVKEKELALAVTLIEQLAGKFNIKDFKDSYAEELLKVIDKKAKGKPVRMKSEAVPTYTEMQDLMSALQKSLRKKSSSKK